MNNRASLATAVLIASLLLADCGSGSGRHIASPTAASGASSSPAPTPPRRTATTAPAATGAPTCPTQSQVRAALGGTFSGPITSPAGGGAIVCEYTGSAGVGNAGVTIFAHETPAVFAGQVANAGTAAGMQKISGVGDGAFGLTTNSRSVVNAYSNSNRTLVAAQAPATLTQTEALARVALADN